MARAETGARLPRLRRIAALVHLVRAGLAFDGFAVVAPSNAERMLPLIAQPLALGRFRVAVVIFGSSSTKRKVRAGALAVTLSSAALVLVVIQPCRRARWLLRMVKIEARSAHVAVGQKAVVDRWAGLEVGRSLAQGRGWARGDIQLLPLTPRIARHRLPVWKAKYSKGILT
jgi:hypothetical protein